MSRVASIRSMVDRERKRERENRFGGEAKPREKPRKGDHLPERSESDRIELNRIEFGQPLPLTNLHTVFGVCECMYV